MATLTNPTAVDKSDGGKHVDYPTTADITKYWALADEYFTTAALEEVFLKSTEAVTD